MNGMGKGKEEGNGHIGKVSGREEEMERVLIGEWIGERGGGRK